MSKKQNWVPLAAAVGAVAGVFYLISNSRDVRTATYRGVSSVADRVGYDLPDAAKDFILAPYPADPRFSVGLPRGWANDSWLQPNPYAANAPTPGYTPPSGGAFGVRLG